MGTNDWAVQPITDGYSSFSVGVFTPNASNLAEDILLGEFGNILQGIEDYINSIMYFPLDRFLFRDFENKCLAITDDIFKVATYTKKFDDISAEILASNHPFFKGFYMGKYDFNQLINNDFTDYEPYTRILIYLPYFGYAELSVKDVYKKFVYFRLCIDFRTGQGTYYVYTTDIEYEMESGDHTFYIENLVNATCIGTYMCQIGIRVPISTTGASDRNRDMILSIGRAAISAGILYATHSIPTAYAYSARTVSGQTSKISSINPKTNRLRVSEKLDIGESRIEQERYSYVSPEHETANIVAQLSNNILANFASTPEFSQGGSPTNYLYDTQNIHIIIKRSKVLPINSDYNHIFGKPLGVSRRLQGLYGYTKIIDFKIDENYQELISRFYGTIPNDEMNMLHDLMNSGVYLPEQNEINILSE